MRRQLSLSSTHAGFSAPTTGPHFLGAGHALNLVFEPEPQAPITPALFPGFWGPCSPSGQSRQGLPPVQEPEAQKRGGTLSPVPSMVLQEAPIFWCPPSMVPTQSSAPPKQPYHIVQHRTRTAGHGQSHQKVAQYPPTLSSFNASSSAS